MLAPVSPHSWLAAVASCWRGRGREDRRHRSSGGHVTKTTALRAPSRLHVEPRSCSLRPVGRPARARRHRAGASRPSGAAAVGESWCVESRWLGSRSWRDRRPPLSGSPRAWCLPLGFRVKSLQRLAPHTKGLVGLLSGAVAPKCAGASSLCWPTKELRWRPRKARRARW